MGSDAIGNNTSATSARGYLRTNNDKLQKTQGELSSGSQVSDPSQKPAKAAVYAQIKSQIRSLNAASQNIAQAESLLQFVAGALSSTQEILTDIYAITIQANTGLLSDQDREIVNADLQSKLEQVKRNSEVTWGDTQLLTGGVGAGSFIAPPATGTSATSGFVLGSVDASSINVDFSGSTYIVSLSVGGQLFKGTATPGVSGGALGSVSLTSTIDPGTRLTIPNVGFLGGETEAVIAESIRTATGLNTGTPVQYIPSASMTKANADAAITNIQPGSGNRLGYHFLTYGTDGTNAIFKWQDSQSVISTTIPIADLVTKFSTGPSSTAAAFNGIVSLNDGTKLTLANFDLTQLTTFPGAISYVQAGTTRTLNIQSGDDPYQIATLQFSSATIAGLGLAGIDTLSIDNARAAGIAIKQAIELVASQIGNIGGFKAQLNYTGRNVAILVENQSAALSEIADTDIPKALIDTQKYEALVDLSTTGVFNSLKKTEKLVDLVKRVRGA
jgi:flagellin-like hook-associated protein FlgL